MTNSIAQKFNVFSLLKFAFPTMVMMVFMSLYTIVDGIFVSRLVGSNALSAVQYRLSGHQSDVCMRDYAINRWERHCRTSDW